MVNINDIVSEIVSRFQIVVFKGYDETRGICRADFSDSPLPFDENTLYIDNGRSREGGMSDRPDNCLLVTADSSVRPFIPVRLSHPVDPVRLYDAVSAKLKEESLLQSEVNTLYRLLHASSGLDELVKQFEKYIGRPVSVCDASYSMMAVSPMMRGLSYGIEEDNAGTFLSVKEVESLRRLQIEQKIYENHRAFFVSTADHPDTNWIFCAIRIQHVVTGYVAVCLPDSAQASGHDLRLTTEFADICAVEMQKHEFFMNRSGLNYETFLTELLEGHFNDVNIIGSRLELLDRHFGRYFCIIVLECSEPHNSDLFNSRQMTTLRKDYPGCMSVVYKDRIVMFINQDTPIRLSEEYMAPLSDFAGRNHMKAGVSQPFADILKVKLFYEQALNTLELAGGDSANGIRLFYSSDALPLYIFSCCDCSGLEIGIHHHLYHLHGYDMEFHTDLLRTLRTYLECDRNAARTADALHIHRSTFFYRIKKIEELLKIDISDSHLLFLYELSFRIWDYLSR